MESTSDASLDEHADDTSIADELKAALRLPAEKRRRCEQCDTTTSVRILQCGACRVVYYCNRGCQAAHWQQHKLVCKELERKRRIAAAAKAAE
jgi:hypothetical protein